MQCNTVLIPDLIGSLGVGGQEYDGEYEDIIKQSEFPTKYNVLAIWP